MYCLSAGRCILFYQSGENVYEQIHDQDHPFVTTISEHPSVAKGQMDFFPVPEKLISV